MAALIACIAATCIIAAGCGGGGAPSSVTGVEGVVRDAAAGRAVDGADVTIGGATTQTDIEGRFQLLDLSTGVQAITVRATGYARYTATVTVSNGITALPDILLVDSPPPVPQ